MDDIANQTGISKKTIYQFFDDKNAIVTAVVDDLIESHIQLFKTAQSTASDAIDEVLKQDAGFSLICTGLRPSFFFELENFFPDILNRLEQYKLKIHQGILDNLSRGKQEGFYRKDVDSGFISDLRLHQIINVLDPERMTSQNLTVNQLGGNLTILYLHAIATEKGKSLLEEYVKENRSTGPGTDNERSNLN